jgi:hypothetical protein
MRLRSFGFSVGDCKCPESKLGRLEIVMALLLVAISPCVFAQNISVQTPDVASHVEMQGLSSEIIALQAKVTSATTRLFKIKECHSQGFLFRTLSDGTEGCQAVVPCQTPWGTVLGVGQGITTYQAATAPYGSACASEVRICNQSTGILTGASSIKPAQWVLPRRCLAICRGAGKSPMAAASWPTPHLPCPMAKAARVKVAPAPMVSSPAATAITPAPSPHRWLRQPMAAPVTALPTTGNPIGCAR